MSSDRTKSEELTLTREFLALMLGVRRPTVSVAPDTLAQAGIIDYKRGKNSYRRSREASRRRL